jgi:hypothetical protein
MASKKVTPKKARTVEKQGGPAIVTPNGTEDVEKFETTEVEVTRDAQEKEETKDVLIRKADKADIRAAKPAPAELPFAGPREQIFECPQGCIKTGPADRGSDYCPTHGIKINPRR